MECPKGFEAHLGSSRCKNCFRSRTEHLVSTLRRRNSQKDRQVTEVTPSSYATPYRRPRSYVDDITVTSSRTQGFSNSSTTAKYTSSHGN
eukprot:09361.XXX_274789_274464_1 [CDS] Oithona nana genome sequencing.